MEQEWLDIRAAAKYLGVSEPTIYRWMRDGRLTYYKVGDSTRFRREDLDAVVRKFTSYEEGKRLRQRCPMCGHAEMHSGRLSSTGFVYFRPKNVRFWTFLEPMIRVEASMCPRCGYIALFGDVRKLARLRPEPSDQFEEESESSSVEEER